MIRVSGQNMTEGHPTSANIAADILICQEVDGPLVRRVMRQQDCRTYLPKRDPHQSISWDPQVITVTHKGWNVFHRSGVAENWNLRTPARGLIYVKGFLTEKPEEKVAIAGWWALNSWGKPYERQRENVVRQTTLTKVEKWVKAMHRQDRSIIREADANNIRWDGELRGLRQLHRRGLDRLWVSGIFHPTKQGVWEGPKTGKGNDMQHHSLNVDLLHSK